MCGTCFALCGVKVSAVDIDNPAVRERMTKGGELGESVHREGIDLATAARAPWIRAFPGKML